MVRPAIMADHLHPPVEFAEAREGRERHHAIIANKSEHFTRHEHSIHAWFLPEERLVVGQQWCRYFLADQLSHKGVQIDGTRQSQPDLDFLQASECGVPIERGFNRYRDVDGGYPSIFMVEPMSCLCWFLSYHLRTIWPGIAHSPIHAKDRSNDKEVRNRIGLLFPVDHVGRERRGLNRRGIPGAHRRCVTRRSDYLLGDWSA